MVMGLATSLSLSTRDTVAPVGLEMVAFVSISSVVIIIICKNTFIFTEHF